ncbi:uncharacterized [Tachysurus ichikawai]
MCVHVEKLRILPEAPAPAGPAKENCGRKGALIEHDARHLKLESSATEKPQRAAILLLTLASSSCSSSSSLISLHH